MRAIFLRHATAIAIDSMQQQLLLCSQHPTEHRPPGGRYGGEVSMWHQITRAEIHAAYLKRLRERIQALAIKATLGTRRAAGYLRNCGWSLEGAVAFLARA